MKRHLLYKIIGCYLLFRLSRVQSDVVTITVPEKICRDFRHELVVNMESTRHYNDVELFELSGSQH